MPADMEWVDETVRLVMLEGEFGKRYIEELKHELLRFDPLSRAHIATRTLPLYRAIIERYTDLCAFLRALQVGADGVA